MYFLKKLTEPLFLRSLRPNFGFHLVLTSFHLEFSVFWILKLFDLGDLSNLINYFKNCIKLMHFSKPIHLIGKFKKMYSRDKTPQPS